MGSTHHFLIMKFGAHVSSAGGLHNAPERAAAIGCEVLQMFSRPPQGGKPKPITPEVAEKFKGALRNYHIERVYVHAPYTINLASARPQIHYGSVAILRDELERCSTLGCRAMMFHPGSARDLGQKKGEKKVVEGLNRILDGYEGSCQLLIEISAGAGLVMGDTFEELARFIEKAERGDEIGICFDTQHAFASGYDLRTKDALNQTVRLFEKTVGIKKLMLSHCNDSKIGLNEHKDRHEHLGEGLIGLEAFKEIVRHPKLQRLDLILETPVDQKRKKDLDLLKSFRKK